MTNLKNLLQRWTPAVLLMAAIFFFSSRPSTSLPRFTWGDEIVKKGGHMLGYGLLAATYWHGLGLRAGQQPLAWLLAILYAVSDEFHQSFVPGRHPAVLDVLVFDNLGAVLGLLVHTHYSRKASPFKEQGPA